MQSSRGWGRVLAFGAVASLGVIICSGVASAEQPGTPVTGAETVGGPMTAIRVDVDLRDLPSVPAWREGDPIKEIPRRVFPTPDADPAPPYAALPDPLAELQSRTPVRSDRAFTIPIVNQDAQDYSGVNPPDTVGDVGMQYFLQAINDGGGATVVVYGKDGSVAAGPFLMDSLGTGSCASGYGDPIVLYDRQADRWFLQEFSASGNYMCMYISQTPDPVSGGWFHYQLQAPSFPDYPHFGVMDNAYIATSNEGTPPIYALDRANMLAGTTARTTQRVTVPQLSGYDFEALTPADLDGANPMPPGSPGIIMRHYDDEAHDGAGADPNGDKLQLWTFSVDFDNAANSVLSSVLDIPITEYNSEFIDYSTFYSVPQPGSSSRLDPIREVILNRLQYVNFGTYESLVGVLPTNLYPTSSSSVNAAQRWFELRKTGGGSWALYQEGTYDPGVATQNRFVGSIAVDQSGNIALGYSFTDTAGTSASLKYTGRLTNDPLSTMTQAETDIVVGSGAGSGRWGDYAAMSVDPADDCTFWFTSEYQNGGSWNTRLASFAFEACGCDLSISPLTATAGVGGDNRIDVNWNDSATPEITEYRIFRSTSSGGPYELLTTIADTSPATGNGTGYTHQDLSVSGGTTYFYVVRASDGAACQSADSNEASETATGACTLTPEFDGIDTAATTFESTCGIDLTWSAGAGRCIGSDLRYSVYRSTTQGFTPEPGDLVASALSGTTFTDTDQLVTGTPYYYVIRATDLVSGLEEDNIAEGSAIPYGPVGFGTFADDAGDTGVATLAMESPWTVAATGGHTSPMVYQTGAYGNDLCSGLETSEMLLDTGASLSFWTKYAIENGYDKGEVQISDDGGSSWTRVALTPDYPVNSTHATDACGLPTGLYFTGTNTTWTEYTADLATWAGQNVSVRWVLSSDGSLNGSGWLIDDVQITGAGVPSACTPGVGGSIFADDFESGMTSSWSITIP